MIHELHKREEQIQEIGRSWPPKEVPDFIKDMEIYPNPTFKTATFEGYENSLIFKNLSNLEEEHTILGINVPKFLKKKKMNKLDVLSENAFLCAFNLLPRIDHQKARNDNIEDNIQTNQDNLSSYYDWLLLQLNQRNEQVEKKYLL